MGNKIKLWCGHQDVQPYHFDHLRKHRTVIEKNYCIEYCLVNYLYRKNVLKEVK